VSSGFGKYVIYALKTGVINGIVGATATTFKNDRGKYKG
jgi:hypothetical protein